MPTADPEFINDIRVPAAATLKAHGLTRKTWLVMANEAGFACEICGKKPRTGILHIDHEHVRGYKKMAPEDRAQYQRGLVCQFCNRFVLARTMTLEKAVNIVEYLKRYRSRRRRGLR